MRKSFVLFLAAVTLFAIGCSGGDDQAAGTSTTGTSPGGDMNSMKKDDPTADPGTTTGGATSGGDTSFATFQAATGKFCMPCHNSTNKKDDVDLTAFKSAADVKTHAADLVKVLESKKMPPANAGTQPSDEERAALVTAIKAMQ